MAKRPTRSQANDATAAPTGPKTRRRSTPPGELGPESSVGLEPPPDTSETYAAREEPRSDPQPVSSDAFVDAPAPSEEEIRARAYQRFLARGAEHGSDFDDWVGAEEELRTERRKA